ncbi:HAD-IA family hydrolase [Iodobacter fluviatilis]|uniref:Haloacid dehalogenase n=1 Tax=Iodobacter fluviatilis TaxID=537 RepID=A0A7G3G5L2_9NEIS|nr:HAD-IA family hydrolase [Iodobacter fluviatilis]QBC42571.1 haloacid dehalogenase [Iodobacter fluviatilis]
MMFLNAQALLFDMDGTLVDSSSKVAEVWSAWCQRHDIDFARVMAIQQGVRSEDTIRRVAPHLDCVAEGRWVDQYEADDCTGVVQILGATQFLAALPSHRWTVVTSAGLQLASNRLSHCQLPIPAHIVCAEDVSVGKPDPEAYRLAASRLNFAPQDCIVFEDAPAGIASALAAGCQVVQIGGRQKLHPNILAVLQDWQALCVVSTRDGLLLSLGEMALSY